MHHDLRILWLYFLHLIKLAFNPFRHLKFEHLHILNNCVFFTEMICSFIIFRSSAIIPLSWKKNGVLESLFINVTCQYVTIVSYVSLIWWIDFLHFAAYTSYFVSHIPFVFKFTVTLHCSFEISLFWSKWIHFLHFFHNIYFFLQ